MCLMVRQKALIVLCPLTPRQWQWESIKSYTCDLANGIRVVYRTIMRDLDTIGCAMNQIESSKSAKLLND